MSNTDSRRISKVVREVGENLIMLMGIENAEFLLAIYGNPNRARNAPPYQNRQAERILEEYNLL